MKSKSEEHDRDKSLDEIKGSPFYEHVIVYHQLKNYGVSKDGMLMYNNGDSPVPLCYGSMIITEELHKYDGADNEEIFFRVEGITQNGIKLRPVTVSAADFYSLNWITKEWGSSIVVMPKQTAKQILAAGLLLTGRLADRQTVYTHTGYHIRDGCPDDYLSVSGSLMNIPENKCEIIPGLSRYKLSGRSSNDEEKIKAINASINLIYAHAPQVTAPLFAFVYMVPILPLIKEVIGETSFLMFLLGKTQSGKSTLAALYMSHFGKFNSQTPPTTFASTSNAIGEMAFILKDLILWVDDYHPKMNLSEASEQNKIFQFLVRMSGDHATRRRLDSNAKLREEKPPRCLFLVTGEDSPQIGQSGHARVFRVEVPEARSDISQMRKDSREGVLSRAMSDYIADVITNYGELKNYVRELYETIYNRVCERFGECRLSSQVTLLCLSAKLYTEYAVRQRALSEAEADVLYRSIEESVIINARSQQETIKEEDPCIMYISAVNDLLSSGRAAVIDLNKSDDVSLNDRDGVKVIGWVDDKGYYLNANKSYSAVSDYYKDQNMSYVVNPTTLWKQLKESKLIIPDKRKNTPQAQKCIRKDNKRVLWFNRTQFDPKDDSKQTNN